MTIVNPLDDFEHGIILQEISLAVRVLAFNRGRKLISKKQKLYLDELNIKLPD